MKKALLGLVFLGALFVSCKEKTTEEKVEDAVESVGKDIENTAEEAVEKTEEAVEKAADKTEEALKKE